MSLRLGFEIKFDKFLGGLVIFEVILKFCYGFFIDLSFNNVVLLRCVLEFLEMIEEFEDGNLIFKIEVFFIFIVLVLLRDFIIVFKICESFFSWVENF